MTPHIITSDELQQAIDEINYAADSVNTSLLEDVLAILRAVQEREGPKQAAWLTDREEMYFDKEDARQDSDGFIQPLYSLPEPLHD